MKNEIDHEEIFASSNMPSKSTGTWGQNELEGDTIYIRKDLTDRRTDVDALIDKIEPSLDHGPFGYEVRRLIQAIRGKRDE